jgi:PAS domain S-box-containing protein
MMLSGKKWPISLMLVIGIMVVAGLIGAGYIMGERLYAVESPLLNAVGEIELEASRVRLWMRALAAGEEKYDNGLLFNHLEQAILYLASFTGAAGSSVDDSKDGKTAALAPQIDHLRSFLETWKQFVLGLASRQPRDNRPALLQAEIDRSFSDFFSALFKVKAAISSTVEKSRIRFRIVQAVSIGLAVLLAIGTALALLCYERRRVNDFALVKQTQAELENELARRKEAEAALKRRELLIRTVFENSPVALVVTRLSDHRVIDVNEAFVASSGYEKPEVLGRTFQEIPIWADPAARGGTLRRLLEERRVRDLEFQFRMKDGSLRTFLISANIVDIDDEPHVLASARDVTELRYFDAALRASEERLRAVVDNLPVGVWFTDAKGTIVYGNPAGRRIWAGAHFVGPEAFHEYKAWWAETGKALTLEDWAVVRAVRNGETSLNEVLEIECFDRTRKIIHNSAVPMRDPAGQIIGVVVLNEDISERKIAEKRTTWLASFPQLNPNPVVEVDLDGRLHYINPAAQTAFPDLSRQGTRHAWFSGWESLARDFRDGSRKTDVREVACDGRWYHQGLAWVDEVRRLRIYGLDITARKQAEEILKTSHDALETWVDDRTRQLRAVNERLKMEVKERSRTERALLKHQTQLRRLSSALVQTEERERRRLSTAIHDSVGQTLAAAKIKLGAIRSLLPVSSQAGQIDEVCDLISSAIRETRTLTFELSLPVLYEIGLQPALEWLAEQIKRKFGLQVVIEGDGCDRSLSVPDRVFLFQAVRELCYNAVKHARATRVVVSIHDDDNAGIIQCEIADDGIGCDVAKPSGVLGNEMGFGLFSIREQLRQYGGTLTLETSAGNGTRVVLRLPMNIQNTLQGGAADEDPGAPGGRP